MLNGQRPNAHGDNEETSDHNETEFRDIYALTPLQSSSLWDTTSGDTSTRSFGSETALSEHIMTMSREFNSMVAVGATTAMNGNDIHDNNNSALARIGEDDHLEETNPLAIVPDFTSISSPRRLPPTESGIVATADEMSVVQVRKEEVESKIAAWQTAEVAKIDNRFKRDEVVINGWESEQVEKATAWLKKLERKLEEKRAKAMEKTQNEVAKARRKAEEKMASEEAKRGTKVARVLELANFMRAIGRAPSNKRSFF